MKVGKRLEFLYTFWLFVMSVLSEPEQASHKKPLQTDLAVFVFVIFFCAFHSRCLYMSICILFLVRVTSRNRCAGLGQKTLVKPKLDKAQNLNWHMIADQVNKLLYFVLYVFFNFHLFMHNVNL